MIRCTVRGAACTTGGSEAALTTKKGRCRLEPKQQKFTSVVRRGIKRLLDKLPPDEAILDEVKLKREQTEIESALTWLRQNSEG